MRPRYSRRPILIGNSITADLEQPSWKVITIPGANWETIKQYIMAHIDELMDAFIYVHVGPVRFTRLHRTNNRKEVALVTPRRMETPKEIWREVIIALDQVNSMPVLCTLYPMDFDRVNYYYARSFRNRSGRQILKGFYSEWERRLRGMVVVENRGIVACNERDDVITAFLHKAVFIRRRRHYVFRSDRFLRDGIHPTPSLQQKWKDELKRAHSRNLRLWHM